MLLQDWVASTPELMIGSEEFERFDRFTYLGILISPYGLNLISNNNNNNNNNNNSNNNNKSDNNETV
ncbi:unnamed protein product [Schistosoma margrebowiei]|uniref:Uncharacterized protein n=1 Tax=Schistosoma margrebowiei TaxID=48269 RepID=A0A183MXM9_9TREM|nr:unnamed protein product [Schistosoma margrebowiei]